MAHFDVNVCYVGLELYFRTIPYGITFSLHRTQRVVKQMILACVHHIMDATGASRSSSSTTAGWLKDLELSKSMQQFTTTPDCAHQNRSKLV